MFLKDVKQGLVWVIGLLVVLTLCFAGVASAQKTTITFWQAGGSEELIALTRRIINDFEEKYPDVTVNYQVIPWAEDPHVKYQTAILGGTMADVFSLGDPFQYVLAAAGALEPLNEYIPEDMLNDFVPATIDRNTIDGKLVALPWYVSVRALFYRSDLLAEEGIPEPTTSWTWDEFVEYTKRLTKDTDGDGKIDQYGFGTSGQYVSQYLPFLWQNDADFLDDKNEVATSTDPKAIEALQFYIDLVREHNVVPPGSTTIDLHEIQRMFANGQVALFIDAQDTAFAFDREPLLEGKFGVGLLPHTVRHASFSGADVVAISATSKNKEAAWQFMEHLLSPSAMADYCLLSGFTPVRASVSEYEEFQHPLRAPFLEQAQLGSMFYYSTPSASAFTRIIRPHVQEVMEGQKTVEQAMAEIADLINEEFAR